MFACTPGKWSQFEGQGGHPMLRASHSVETQFERTPGELFAHAVSQESVGRLEWFHGGLAASKFTSYTCIHHFT